MLRVQPVLALAAVFVGAWLFADEAEAQGRPSGFNFRGQMQGGSFNFGNRGGGGSSAPSMRSFSHPGTGWNTGGGFQGSGGSSAPSMRSFSGPGAGWNNSGFSSSGPRPGTAGAAGNAFSPYSQPGSGWANNSGWNPNQSGSPSGPSMRSFSQPGAGWNSGSGWNTGSGWNGSGPVAAGGSYGNQSSGGANYYSQPTQSGSGWNNSGWNSQNLSWSNSSPGYGASGGNLRQVGYGNQSSYGNPGYGNPGYGNPGYGGPSDYAGAAAFGQQPGIGSTPRAGVAHSAGYPQQTNPYDVPNAAAEAIMLINPASTGAAVSFLCGGRQWTIQPGQYKLVSGYSSCVVRFHCGGSFGQKEYTLSGGKMYQFCGASTGWDLQSY